jgi:hypothetical protein
MNPIPNRRVAPGGATAAALLLGVAVAGIAGPAGAAPLAPATFYEYVSGIGDHVFGTDLALPETATIHVETDRGIVDSTVTTDGTLPRVGIAGNVVVQGKDSPAGFGGLFSRNVDFQFMVEALGPSPLLDVPIDVDAVGAVAFDYALGNVGGDGFSAVSEVYIPGVGKWTASRVCSLGTGCTSNPESFDVLHTADVRVGRAYDVEVRATAHGQGGGETFFFDATSFVNLAIAISAVFGDADQYRVVFSPGITTAMVPLPAPLPLLLGGLAGLGVAGRRRRR